MAEHRSMLGIHQNTFYPRFSFTGIAFPNQVFCIYCEGLGFASRKPEVASSSELSPRRERYQNHANFGALCLARLMTEDKLPKVGYVTFTIAPRKMNFCSERGVGLPHRNIQRPGGKITKQYPLPVNKPSISQKRKVKWIHRFSSESPGRGDVEILFRPNFVLNPHLGGALRLCWICLLSVSIYKYIVCSPSNISPTCPSNNTDGGGGDVHGPLWAFVPISANRWGRGRILSICRRYVANIWLR